MDLDPDTYGTEIAPGAGCGPDLFDTDPAFAALMDFCEEKLPERFGDFDRTEFDFPDLFNQMDGFLKQSRDIRLLAYLGRFSLLNGNLNQFANSIRTIQKLLNDHWESVQPDDADFDHMERLGALEGLNSRPTVFLPLEAAPLLKTRRSGPISYRTIQIAAGTATARADEPTISLGAIEAALTSGEMEQEQIDLVLKDLAELPDLLETISGVCAAKLEETGKEAAAPNFENLCTLLREMSSELNLRLGRIEPGDDTEAGSEDAASADADETEQTSEPTSTADLTNAAQAKQLLQTVETYFATREPSHPALFLVREAHGLVGRTYLDALKILMPRRFDDVSLLLGTSGLQLSNDRLRDLNDSGTGDLGDVDGYEAPTISNRNEAMKAITAVKAYFSTNEPTSPIPLLLEEAQNMSSGSFTGLLNLFLRPDDD
ncbi:ImpA family type VI secretion system protein [Roseibium sp.]|uniref:type VI secretion system protein TssA n=1 Tax=Roseibium sp. TaxID=1936156 RepID=UPI003B51819B